MWKTLWPLLLIIASNCFYNICTKSMPDETNSFASLTVTYLVGAILCAILFIVSAKPANVPSGLKTINWTAFVLGIAIVGLELGYVFLYRAGWKVSNGALTANICLAVALLFIGALLYKESISVKQILGIVICSIGLFLISG